MSFLSDSDEEVLPSPGVEKQLTLDETTTVDGVSQYLQFHGIPTKFCSSIAESYIDGEELLTMTAAELTMQSWSDKMVERVRNVVKLDNKRGKRPLENANDLNTPKRKKKDSEMLQRYPIQCNSDANIEDSETMEEHKRAIACELSKTKPRESVLLPLMKSTFGVRRMLIFSDDASVCSVLEEYPALNRPVMIEQEMRLIFSQSDVKSLFLTQWLAKYVPAIIAYGKKSSKKKVTSHLSSLDELDDTARQLVALKIISEVLGKGLQSLSFLYEEYNGGDSLDVILQKCKKEKPAKTQPRIAAIIGEGSTQYFIFCENRVFCSVQTLSTALFVSFSTYYCFNLAYPPAAKNIFYFIQDFILGHPDATKKTATYLSVVSDIKCNL